MVLIDILISDNGVQVGSEGQLDDLKDQWNDQHGFDAYS